MLRYTQKEGAFEIASKQEAGSPDGRMTIHATGRRGDTWVATSSPLAAATRTSQSVTSCLPEDAHGLQEILSPGERTFVPAGIGTTTLYRQTSPSTRGHRVAFVRGRATLNTTAEVRFNSLLTRPGAQDWFETRRFVAKEL